MEIRLTDGFCIDQDEFQYILKQRYTAAKKKDGSGYESVKVISYHRTLEQAVEKYIYMRQNLLRPDTAVSLREYVNLVKRDNKEAVKAIKSLIGT